ncbi:MAG: hypothetical protein Q8L47_04725 [bacterium]|nr:hypothetical protein [bacterium]
MEGTHNACIAATARGESCPLENNLSQVLTYHFDSFRSFSTATLSDNLSRMLLFLFALTLISGFWVFKNIGSILAISTSSQNNRPFLKPRESLFQLNLIHWLSLHENSPSFS